MATTYYIRKIGSDSNNGTSAATAWLTIGKALGASGISSGDTVYIGAGVYREVVSVAMTSAVAETKVYGDVDGSKTGDAGEVQWTAYVTNDTTAPSATTLLDANGRDFLTFQDLVLIGGSTTIATLTTSVSTDIKFTRCLFIPGARSIDTSISYTSAANVAANITIDSCTFIGNDTSSPLFLTLTRPATADFNYNIIVKNCLFIGSSILIINVSSTGANTFNGGGVDVRNCTVFGGSAIVRTSTANTSTSIPCTVYNCYLYGLNTGVSANTLGQIVEDYNIFACDTARLNVAIGTHSISNGSYAPLFFTGHEYYSVGSNLMPFGMPKPTSPLLGFGNQAASPSTDILQAARPSGFVKAAAGTATSGAAKTLTDTGATWGTNSFADYTVKITTGTGNGQTKTIASNTATILTVDGNWKTTPDSSSVYEIYSRATSSTGTATSGTTTTLTDSNAAWGTNMWAGYTLSIDAGTGSGQTFTVTTNTATALTFAAGTAPDATSTYSLYRGTGINVLNAGVGCYEYGGSAIKETVTVKTGANALRIPSAGYIDFEVPVNTSVSQTITIYAQFDSFYSGTKPSMNIVNGGECGVTSASSTQTGSSGSWEQLTLTFTPTSNGIITVRLISASTTPTGNAYFDDFQVV